MKYLRVSQAAKLLGCSREAVRQLCERGTFPNAFRRTPSSPWNIPAEEVEAHCAVTGAKPKAPAMVTTSVAAKLLGRSGKAVLELCERGAFPNAFRLFAGSHWRIPLDDIEAMKAARAQPVQRRKAGEP